MSEGARDDTEGKGRPGLEWQLLRPLPSHHPAEHERGEKGDKRNNDIEGREKRRAVAEGNNGSEKPKRRSEAVIKKQAEANLGGYIATMLLHATRAWPLGN